jgi:hypothetical protein
MFVAENGSFLEKEFLSKGVSGRKVELDEVIVQLMPHGTPQSNGVVTILY